MTFWGFKQIGIVGTKIKNYCIISSTIELELNQE